LDWSPAEQASGAVGKGMEAVEWEWLRSTPAKEFRPVRIEAMKNTHRPPADPNMCPRDLTIDGKAFPLADGGFGFRLSDFGIRF
jgi:hypothetical protein